jgi:outer membrane protein assembly factor BamB
VRVALAALLVVLFAACGGEDEPQSEATSSESTVEAVRPPFEDGEAFASCGGEVEFLPQYAATVAFDSVWVACRTDGEVLRLDAESGNVLARIPAQGAVAVTADDTSVWAVWREQGTVYRIDPEANEVAGEINLFTDTPYIWARGGFLWAAPADGTEIARIDPETMEVAGRVQVGDGASDIVEDGETLLVICHRDHTLWRVDPATDTAVKLSELPGDTPERLVLAGGALWATGRGTDLLRVDPATGETQETIEIGTGGIDLVTTDDAIWVAVAEPEADAQGLPVLERLVSVDTASGELGAEHTPTGTVNVTGLAAEGEDVWIADVVAGVLSRLR